MEKPKKPNALAELMANSSNPANRKSNLSAATLKALERFGPGNASKNIPPNRLEPGDISAASVVVQKALERFGTNKSEPLPLPGTNWELWALMPKAPLTEVVAASLGIDPSGLKPRSGYAEPGKKFDDRLKLACAYVSEDGPLKPIKKLGHQVVWGKPEEATVSLPEFAQWALNMGWELPEKFPRLKAAPRQAMTPSPATTPSALSVVAVGASNGVEPDKDGPVVKAQAQGNSTKAPRKDSIDPVIELAQTKCRDPKDTNQVWPQMQVLADNEQAPFLASTAKGLKYHKNGKDAYFTRDALDKRLHPEKRNGPAARR